MAESAPVNVTLYMKAGCGLCDEVKQQLGRLQAEFPHRLAEVDIESCGKSRVLIGGLAVELHRRNLRALYNQMYGTPRIRTEDDDEYEDEDLQEEDE